MARGVLTGHRAPLVCGFGCCFFRLLSHNADTGSAMNTFQKASYMNYAFEVRQRCPHSFLCLCS